MEKIKLPPYGISNYRQIKRNGIYMVDKTMNPYYLVCPEVELNHGYCDFFLLPDITCYLDVRHSYIIELKYLPMTVTEARGFTSSLPKLKATTL